MESKVKSKTRAWRLGEGGWTRNRALIPKVFQIKVCTPYGGPICKEGDFLRR